MCWLIIFLVHFLLAILPQIVQTVDPSALNLTFSRIFCWATSVVELSGSRFWSYVRQTYKRKLSCMSISTILIPTTNNNNAKLLYSFQHHITTIPHHHTHSNITLQQHYTTILIPISYNNNTTPPYSFQHHIHNNNTTPLYAFQYNKTIIWENISPLSCPRHRY